MKKLAKQMLKRALLERRYKYWAHPLATQSRRPLNADQRLRVDQMWGRVRLHPNYRWHEHYACLEGSPFDERYVPSDVFYLNLLPCLSNLSLADAWSDKAYYELRFPSLRFAQTLAVRIDGHYYDASLQPCSSHKLWMFLGECGRVFMKPSMGSYTGIGAQVLERSRFSMEADFNALLSSLGDNLVMQRLVIQHDILAALNESSVNIIRINTLRLDADPVILSATIRFGVAGRVTDMTYIDGVEIGNMVGIDASGRIDAYTYNQCGKRTNLSDLGIAIGGCELPGYHEACDMCTEVHRQLHHFGFVAFDIAIDAQGKPVMIEYNLDGPGVVFYQYTHGPLFGEHTQAVIEYVLKKGTKISFSSLL